MEKQSTAVDSMASACDSYFAGFAGGVAAAVVGGSSYCTGRGLDAVRALIENPDVDSDLAIGAGCAYRQAVVAGVAADGVVAFGIVDRLV